MPRRRLLLSSISIFSLALAGCGGLPTDAPMFDPRQMTAGERDTAQQDVSEPIRPLPTTQEDPLGGSGDEDAGTTQPAQPAAATTGPALGSDAEPIMHISLQQAIQRAVLYNHTVKVAGYQPAIDAATVVEAEARYDPVFFAQAQFQKKDDENGGTDFTNPATGGLIQSRYDNQSIATAQVGIKQQLESGAQVQLHYDSSYNYLVPRRFLDNPYYQNSLTFQITQPLLKNFGADVNNARIVINRENARISVLEFRKALEDQVSKVEETYWKLVNAQDNVLAEEDLLRTNQETYQLQLDRFKNHLNSILEISQAQAFLNNRQATLIQAKSDLRNLSDQLKQLMDDPNIPITSPALLLPSDDPVTEPMHFSIDEQINSGMQNRFELGEQLLKIDQASVTYNVAKNNALPELDFSASVTPNSEGNYYRRVLSEQAKFGNWDYSLGLQFQFALGNREALSIVYRTSEQRFQAIEQYNVLIDQVALDVREAARQVTTSYDVIIANRNARFAAEKALTDLIHRAALQIDPQDATYVQLRLQLSDQLTQAREAENQAIATYNIALEELEKAKGTLLRYDNVILQEEKPHDEGLLH